MRVRNFYFDKQDDGWSLHSAWLQLWLIPKLPWLYYGLICHVIHVGLRKTQLLILFCLHYPVGLLLCRADELVLLKLRFFPLIQFEVALMIRSNDLEYVSRIEKLLLVSLNYTCMTIQTGEAWAHGIPSFWPEGVLIGRVVIGVVMISIGVYITWLIVGHVVFRTNT